MVRKSDGKVRREGAGVRGAGEGCECCRRCKGKGRGMEEGRREKREGWCGV